LGGKPEGAMSEPSKNERKTIRGRFQPGNKYGKGRPEGSRNKATITLQSLLDEEGEAITRKAIELAKKGDSTAMRLVIERLIPPTRERRVSLPLPMVTTAADTTAALGAVLEGVARGELTPSEGQALAGLLESQRRNIETLDLESRLAAIEQNIAGKEQK
jgi:hypothetical protein